MPGSESPRCLHEWNPHGGAEVHTLIFLDDHSERTVNGSGSAAGGNSSKFWKYALTGEREY